MACNPSSWSSAWPDQSYRTQRSSNTSSTLSSSSLVSLASSFKCLPCVLLLTLSLSLESAWPDSCDEQTRLGMVTGLDLAQWSRILLNDRPKQCVQSRSSMLRRD